jgi:hypothetical protein
MLGSTSHDVSGITGISEVPQQARPVIDGATSHTPQRLRASSRDDRAARLRHRDDPDGAGKPAG